MENLTETQALTKLKEIVEGLNESPLQDPIPGPLQSVLGMVATVIEDGGLNTLDNVLRANYPDYYFDNPNP